MWFTEHVLKHKAPGKSILLSYDHRSHSKFQKIVAFCNSANKSKNPLAVKENTIIEHLIFGKLSSSKKIQIMFFFFVLHHVDSVETDTKKKNRSVATEFWLRLSCEPTSRLYSQTQF